MARGVELLYRYRVQARDAANNLGAGSSIVDIQMANTAMSLDIASPTVQRQIAVVRLGSTPFGVSATPSSAVGPLTVRFNVAQFVEAEINRIEADFYGNGLLDFLRVELPGVIEHTYASPGQYLANARVVTAANEIFTYSVPITVVSSEAAASEIRLVWSQYVAALQGQDIAAGLRVMTEKAAAKFQPVLIALSEDLPVIASSSTSLQIV